VYVVVCSIVGGGRVCVWLVCSILGGGRHPWALLAYRCWHWGERDSDGDSLGILHTNHSHTRPPPYLLRQLQSLHFSTLLHAAFSHIYCVRHDDEVSTSATRIIISLLEPTL